MDKTTMIFSEEMEMLQRELDLATKEKSRVLMEKERMLTFWENSKRDLEELKAQIPQQIKKKAEAARRHQIEISVYRQRLRHTQSEQHNVLFGVKADSIALNDYVQMQNTHTELELRRELQSLQNAERHGTINKKTSLLELHLEHQIKLIEINNSYEAKANEIVALYDQKLNEQIEEFTATTGRETFLLENEMEMCVEEMNFKYEQDLNNKTAFNTRMVARTREQAKKVREEYEAAIRLEKLAERKLAKAEQEEKHLMVVLKKARIENKKLRADYEAFQKTKQSELKHRDRQKKQEREIRRQKVEKELLLQASIMAQREEQKLREFNLNKIINEKLQLTKNFLRRKMGQK